MTPGLLLHLTGSSPEPLRSQIAQQLRNRILSGDLPEGSELPVAHAIAREHRVSPRDVQRALDELLGEGLLEPDGSGFAVAAISAAQRRTLAQRRVLDELRDQEVSLRELEIARDIQRRLLPPARVAAGGVTVVSRWFPARFVAGDFYDVLRHADGSVGVLVADVAGKGFGASLLMASVKAMAPFVAAEHGVAGTLRELNRRLHGGLGRGQFVALAYARIAPGAGEVELANAGMPDPFLLDAGTVEPLQAPGPRLPLGIRAEGPYESVTRPLAPGTRLLLYSDGVPEARRRSGEPLGYDGLGSLVASCEPGAELESWLEALLDEAQRITGPELEDDWTAVAVECRARQGGEA